MIEQTNDKKYKETLEKLAFGFEYEELQTKIEETSHGTKKSITRIKKYQPPLYMALRELQNKESKPNDELMKSIKEFEERFNNANNNIID